MEFLRQCIRIALKLPRVGGKPFAGNHTRIIFSASNSSNALVAEEVDLLDESRNNIVEYQFVARNKK